MLSGGRTTRSKRRLAEQDDGPLSHHHYPPSAKYPHLSEHTILTPPQSQQSQVPDEGRKTRRGRSSVQKPAPYNLDVISPMKTRHGAGSSGSLDVSGSSTSSSDPSLTPFQNEEISLDYGFDLWQNIGGLASENDPFLHKGTEGESNDSTSVNRSRDLHTPTPPMSPDMLSTDVATPMMHHRPETPTIRPETPGEMGNPLTPMDGSLVSSTMDEETSLETTSMIGYGPPPTPMCPPIRVGNLSTSSLCSQLPISSIIPNSVDVDPPQNILESEEESDDRDNDDSSQDWSDNDNNVGTHIATSINKTAVSPDIVTDFSGPLVILPKSGIPSPPSPDSDFHSDHSHRLRIRAFASSPPPRSRSCTLTSTSADKPLEITFVIPPKPLTKPILKYSSIYSSEASQSSKLNFLCEPKIRKKVSYSEDVRGGDEYLYTAEDFLMPPPSYKISIATSPQTLSRLRSIDRSPTSSKTVNRVRSFDSPRSSSQSQTHRVGILDNPPSIPQAQRPGSVPHKMKRPCFSDNPSSPSHTVKRFRYLDSTPSSSKIMNQSSSLNPPSPSKAISQPRSFHNTPSSSKAINRPGSLNPPCPSQAITRPRSLNPQSPSKTIHRPCALNPPSPSKAINRPRALDNPQKPSKTRRPRSLDNPPSPPKTIKRFSSLEPVLSPSKTRKIHFRALANHNIPKKSRRRSLDPPFRFKTSGAPPSDNLPSSSKPSQTHHRPPPPNQSFFDSPPSPPETLHRLRFFDPPPSPSPPLKRKRHPTSSQTLNRLGFHDTTPTPSPTPSTSSNEVVAVELDPTETETTAFWRYLPSPQSEFQDDVQLQDGCFRFLRLRNFMTHKDLTCEWKKNIVFINGQNGSGKSAILTACQLLVGYKAANTNRTTSVTGFIKKGCKHAIIEGGLTNYNGSLSMDKYGEVITLSRKINIGGGSMYKIGTPGETHPRVVHLPELTQIRQALQIDPNNPIQFLQQEQLHRSSSNNSKVGNSRGKKDFQMLKDATHLTEQENLLKDADDNFKEAGRQIGEKKEHRKFLLLQEKQLKEQCDLVHKIEQSEKTLNQLKNEQKWAEVKILEEELTSIKSRKEETFLEIKNLKEEQNKLKDEADTFISMKDKAKKMIASIKKELNQFSNDKEAKINELREVNKTLRRVQNDHILILKAIKGYSKKIAELEESLNEDTISYEEQNQVYEAEAQRCLSLIPDKDAALKRLREKRDNIVAELNEFQGRSQKGQNNVNRMEAELKQAKKELSKKDNVFGPGMRELLDKIARYNKWKLTPVGPLGAHTFVTDERYAPLIEHIIGHSVLYSFVVQTPDDFKALKALIADIYQDKRNKGRVPTVVQMDKLTPAEYMAKLRHTEKKLAGFKTVLSLLSFKDPVVKIGVIEQRGVERIALFDTFKDAATVMKEKNACPSELNGSYTLQWYRVTPFPNYKFQPVGTIRDHTEIIPMANTNTANHIKRKMKEIAGEKEVMETCRKSLEGYKEAGAHRPGLKQMLSGIDGEIKGINKEINELTNKIKHVRSMIRENPVEGQDNNIQNQIKAEQEMRSEQEMKIQVKLQEIELAKQEITRIAEEKDIIDEKIEEGQQKSSELEGEYGNALGTVSKMEKSRDGTGIRIEKLEKEFHQFSLHETKVFEDLNEKTKQAVAAGERPPAKYLERSPNEIQRETEELDLFLNNNSNIVASKKRIIMEYRNSKALVRTISFEIDVVDKLLFKYQRYLKMGQDVVAGLKENIASMLRSNFQTFTELHNLTGTLMVLWDKEMLMYYVSPDQQSDARARQSISVVDGDVVMADKQGMQNYCSNLSGGERAKAQIFFIMSMWEITDLPCHFVDEFETYMDEPSRIQIQRLLIKHAKKHPDKQFFFFTPQILVGVPVNDPSISIMYLKKRVENNKQDEEQEQERRGIKRKLHE